MKKMIKIYLDDLRTPVDKDWTVVRSYDEFVSTVTNIGLENIELISLDHDLGDTAMAEWHRNVYHNYTLDYNNITEKTGMDCCRYLVAESMNQKIPLPQIYVHSANPVGAENIRSILNRYNEIHQFT
jgi:hypothetical protein